MAQQLGFQGTVTTAGGGVAATLDHFALPTFSLDGQAIRLTLWIDDPTRIGNLSLFVGLGSSLTDNVRWRFNAATTSSRLAKPGEVLQVVLQLCELNTVAGSITLSPLGVPSVLDGFGSARLHVADDATGPVTVQLLATELIDATPTGFVSITFDDSWESVFTRAFPKMAEYGFRGTSYEIVEYIGQAGRASMHTLNVLAGAGWEIGGHSFTVAAGANGYTAITGHEVDDDLAALRAWLDTHFPADTYSFAYAQGKYEDTSDGVPIEPMVASNGFTTGRTILSSVRVGTHAQVAAVPPVLPYRLNAMSGVSEVAHATSQFHPDLLTATGGMLDKVAANGGWLILVFHQVVAGDPANTAQISQAGFDQIMDAIAARDLQVLPVREVLEYGSSPQPVSAAWATTESVRLLWADAPGSDTVDEAPPPPDDDKLLQLLIDSAQEVCEIYAPALPEGAPVPKRYTLAVVMQTREHWQATERDGDVLGFDGEYAVRVRPLSASVKALLRPRTGAPRLWRSREAT